MTYASVLDAKNYRLAVARSLRSAAKISTSADAVTVYYRLTRQWLRLGDFDSATKAVDLMLQQANGIQQGALRFPWLARVTGLYLALDRRRQAANVYQSLQRVIEGARLHSHIAVREDFQYLARVIALCECEQLSMAVKSDNFPKTFAKIDRARFRALCEITVAAARFGRANFFSTFRIAAEAGLGTRRRGDKFKGEATVMIAQSYAYAGRFNEAEKRIEQIADSQLKARAIATLTRTLAERKQFAAALSSYRRSAKLGRTLENPLVCESIARAAGKKDQQQLDAWIATLPGKGDRAAALAGAATRRNQ